MTPSTSVEGCRLPGKILLLGHAFELHPHNPTIGLYVCRRCGLPIRTHPDGNSETDLTRTVLAMGIKCGGLIL